MRNRNVGGVVAVDIVRELCDCTARGCVTACRYAAETWMQQNNVMRVTQDGESGTQFLSNPVSLLESRQGCQGSDIGGCGEREIPERSCCQTGIVRRSNT